MSYSSVSRWVKSDSSVLKILLGIVAFGLLTKWLLDNILVAWILFGLLVIAGIILIISKVHSVLGSSPADMAHDRPILPYFKRKELFRRANYRCENPACHAMDVPLDVHHADMDKRNNRLFNLVVLCRACHDDAHHGSIAYDQVKNWVRMDLYQLNQRRGTRYS